MHPQTLLEEAALLPEPPEHPFRKSSGDTLKTEEILLVLHPEHPAGAKAIRRKDCRYPWVDLRLLAEEPFILHFPDQNTGRAAQQLFDQYHIQPHVPFRTQNNQTCIQLAAQGLGASFAPESYVQHTAFLWPMQVFSVGDPPLHNKLVIAYRKNSYLSTFAQEFIQTAKNCLK